jgi:hypothetical protein
MERADDLNEERLRILGRYLADLSLVATVRYFPPGKEDRVIAHLETSYYPDVVDTARLKVRVRLNGEFKLGSKADSPPHRGRGGSRRPLPQTHQLLSTFTIY